MPNWAHNTLTVTGEPDDVKAYVEKVEQAFDDGSSQPLTFAADVPEPDYDDSDSTEGIPDWYHWRVENWGTKWDASFDGPLVAMGGDDADVDASVQTQGRTLATGVAIYKFDTAWAPPSRWLAATAAANPTLYFTLRWGEAGNDVAGEYVAFMDNNEPDGALMFDHEDLPVGDVLMPEEMWF